MKRSARLAALGLISLLTVLTGCAATIAVPPPAAVVEVRPAVPFYGAVWIDGHYAYHSNRYHWVPGRYVRSPYPKAVWTPGQWKHYKRGWRWNKGHWR